MVTETQLAPILQTKADLVAEALRNIYSDQEVRVSLDALRELANASNGLFKVSDLLLSALRKKGLVGRFVNYLRPRGIELEPIDVQALANPGVPDFCAGAPGGPLAVDFPFDVLERFIRQARAFRCLVRIGGVEMGSGAFVSPRLVLTAAHVVEPITDAIVGAVGGQPQGPPKLEIVASDGRTYPARLTWHLPCHAVEHQGQLPPVGSESAHADAALLRVDRPLGRLFGAVDLPNPPVDWTGCGPMMLVHYPAGVQRDFCPGFIRRDSQADVRQQHNCATDGGSSGGPGFDRDGQFLGLHQGRLQNLRRLVPHAQFAKNEAFRAEIDADRPPRYLWSLNGSLDGHIIIGRNAFFDALTAILEGSAGPLSGIWIKRSRTDRTEGLSFSYRILRAFLESHALACDTVRVPTGFETPDLIGQLHELVFAGSGGDGASPGVQDDETTTVAHDDERARNLADALDAHAESADRTLWIYFENPPSGLLQETQIQLEHLVEELIRRPRLRLVLAGFETYDLLPEQFLTVAAARQSAKPGLFVEYLANFKRGDIETTAKGISSALGLNWEGPVLAEMIDRAVRNVPEMSANVFALDQLPQVSENLREEAKASYG